MGYYRVSPQIREKMNPDQDFHPFDLRNYPGFAVSSASVTNLDA
jgi:hypothetical protein